MTNPFEGQPDFESRGSEPVDPLLYKDPVLLLIAERDELLASRVAAVRKAEEAPVRSEGVLSTMRIALQQDARDRHLFPYSSDPILQEEADKTPAFKGILDAFTAARQQWLTAPSDPDTVQRYVEVALTLEEYQDDTGLYLLDDGTLARDDFSQ